MLNEYCMAYVLGEPREYRNMAVIPVNAKKGGKKSDLDYLVFSEGLQSGKVHIQETGTVNQLLISNNSDKDLFIMKGEYVVGGKQNRMITVNGMIAQNTGRLYIPVHCVQHGRWDNPKGFELADFAVSAGIRGSVRKEFAGSAGQGETWQGVSFLIGHTGARTSSQDFHETYRATQEDVKKYVDSFPKEKNQIGAIAVINTRNGKQFFVDMFDQQKTLGRHYERLLASYALEAVAQGGSAFGPEFTKSEVSEFLEDVLKAKTEESASISLGTDHEIRTNRISGSGLVVEDTLVYLGAKNELQRVERTPPHNDPFRRGPPFDPRITIRRGFL